MELYLKMEEDMGPRRKDARQDSQGLMENKNLLRKANECWKNGKDNTDINEEEKPMIRRVLYQDSRWTQDGCFTKTQDGSAMLGFTQYS
jgi:hypothetical protein